MTGKRRLLRASWLLALRLGALGLPAAISGPAQAADFNRDGVADLAVGVPAESVGGGPATSAVNVLYGTPLTGLSATNDDQWHQNVPGVAPAGERAEPFDAFGSALG